MAEHYCLVEDGQITDGPRPLPVSWRNVSGLNLMTDSNLKKVGWLPHVDVKPAYNPETQYLTRESMINADNVTEVYTVNDYTSEELGNILEKAKLKKLAELYANVKQFISCQPNGWPRYDNDLKLNTMNAIMGALAQGEPEPANCTLVKDWINTVQTEFFELKANINSAADIAALNEIDVSYDYLEGKYGRQGGTYPDPGISTDDLIGS
jgi:hypothetical protein